MKGLKEEGEIGRREGRGDRWGRDEVEEDGVEREERGGEKEAEALNSKFKG